MKPFSRLVTSSALAIAVIAAFATPALAHPSDGFRSERDGRRPVPSRRRSRRVRADRQPGRERRRRVRPRRRRHPDPGRHLPTGGNGGVLTGSVVDHLASQGSLTYDAEHALLFAVNAGSNTVSVFSVHGDNLTRQEILPSFGQFPVSVAVHDDLVYVLNALGGGSVQGYGIFGEHLFPLGGSNRALGLNPAATRSS